MKNVMDPQGLSEADKHLMYGLLLKKKFSAAQKRKVLVIVHSSMDLSARIQAILQVTRAQLFKEPDHAPEAPGAPSQGQSTGAPRKGKKKNALIVDERAEIAGLLRKCSLRKDLFFSRIADRYDAVHLIPSLRARLVIVNEILESEAEYGRYFEICRAIEPGVRIIFLGKPTYPVRAGAAFEKQARLLPKPLNVEKLEESANELLGMRREAQT